MNIWGVILFICFGLFIVLLFYKSLGWLIYDFFLVENCLVWFVFFKIVDKC